MNAEFLGKINKIMTAAKSLEDALTEYGGIVDVKVMDEMEGAGIFRIGSEERPLAYKVIVDMRVDFYEGEAAFCGRGQAQIEE